MRGILVAVVCLAIAGCGIRKAQEPLGACIVGLEKSCRAVATAWAAR